MSNPTHDAIKKQLDANPVMLFMKGTPQFPNAAFRQRCAKSWIISGLNLALKMCWQMTRYAAALKNFPTGRQSPSFM